MPTEFDIRTSLKDLPDTLRKAYNEIYQCILAQKKSAPQLALNAFRWVKYSYEPLASKTLLDAVSAQISISGEYVHERLIDTDTILKVCQNLLIFDKRLDTFRFAHLSVEEFLEAKMEEEGLTEASCHTNIAKTCLSLLCSPTYFEKYEQGVVTWEGEYRSRHLLLYSATFWPLHFSRYEALLEIDSGVLVELWERFISQPNYRKWLDYHRSTIKTEEWTYDPFWQHLDVFSAEPKSDNPLFSTCIFGIGRRFKNLFELRPKILDNCMEKLLSYACRFGYVELVKYLLENGAAVTAIHEDKSTPLHIALQNRHQAVARRFLDNDTTVFATNIYKSKPLQDALRTRHKTVEQLLLDRDANISATTSVDWSTPLHLASMSGNEEVAQLLLDYGANVSITNHKGSTPLHLASLQGNEAMGRLLLDKGANISVPNKYGSMPLHLAATHENEAMARLLLDNGASMSTANMYGELPIHLASTLGNEAVVQLLLDRGANVFAADNDKSTPLHYASANGHATVVLLLLDRDADVSAADKFGRTPLHVASERGFEAVTRLLLDKGANFSTGEHELTLH